MSKLSNTESVPCMNTFHQNVAKAVKAAACRIDDSDFIVWAGLNIGILSSSGDWTTGEITEYVVLSIRGLPVEKELMAHFTIHGVPFTKHDCREEPGVWHR